MAWLVWNGVVVDGFEGGRLSVPSSLPLLPGPLCCVCSPCGRAPYSVGKEKRECHLV